MAPSAEQVLQHAASTLNLLVGPGFTVNYLQSVLVPSHQMEFLGSLLNSLDLSLSLPRDKIRKIQSKCQDLLNTPVTTERELSKFLGLLSPSIQAVFPAPLHYRYLQQAKNSVLRFRKSYEAVVHLDSEYLQEVQWWKDNLEYRIQGIQGYREYRENRESRVFLDSSDWKLHPGVFNRLHEKWGPPNIDLFASRLSYQLDQFVSWRPDPLAIHTDAFTLDWATFRGYAFPPFALIGRCLHQIQSQQVSHIMFVAPVWPAQP
ncbi:unnamed protein product [Porites evermanni]|uniref:Uncharacterized protein n=1 Tax=Porites evermanni TaxID=104178 RepID=A0ABN8MGU7_9CNID|nr:unnamed protein product [Porites evermanni]